MPIPTPTSARLRTLIKDLQCVNHDLKTDANVEGFLLRDLRQALDNIRLTAWTANELQNARERNHDTPGMLSFLTAERMRRFRQMVDDFCSDLEHDGIAWPSTSIYGLQESVSVLREQLSLLTFRLLGNRN